MVHMEAAVATQETVVPIKKAISRLHFGRVHLATAKRRHFFVDLPAGTKFEEVIEPAYWGHNVQDFLPLDLLECFCEDGTWEALFRVMFVSKVEARLSLIWRANHDRSDADDNRAGPYEVVWKGPAMKFAVIRTDNQEVIKSHFYPKSDAQIYLQQHFSDLRK